MKIKLLTIPPLLSLLAACQLISPIFVDYNGVRMDVAKWINQQTLLSMQQKRSLVQVSKAQQKLVHIDQISESTKLTLAKENAIAMHCARRFVSQKKIEQLQNQIFGSNDKMTILNKFEHHFPHVKINANHIHCE